MHFLVGKCLEFVVEKNIKLGKELEKVLSLLRCKMRTRIHDCSNVSSLVRTIQYFRHEVIFKRVVVFVILFVMVKIVL